MTVEDASMAAKPPTEEDIGKPVTFWPLINRTEEGVLESYDSKMRGINVRLKNGKLLSALPHEIHRGVGGLIDTR